MPTVTATLSVAVISPVQPVDSDFLSLMEHYCDIQKMSRAVPSSGTYGHATKSRKVVQQTYEAVRCRLAHMDSDEKELTGRSGEVMDDFILWVPFNLLPDELRDPSHSTDYQVVNVRDLNGKPEDGGPFAIRGVQLIAGEDHHYTLDLRRVR